MSFTPAKAATTTNPTRTKTPVPAAEATTGGDPTLTDPLQRTAKRQTSRVDFSRAALTPAAASAAANIQLLATGPVVVLPLTDPLEPVPELTLSRAARMIVAGLVAPYGLVSPLPEAGTHVSSPERPPTATSSDPSTTTQPTAPATTRPAPLTTTAATPATTARPTRHAESRSSSSTPGMTRALGVPRLGRGPVSAPVYLTYVLVALAGVFALTVLTYAASRLSLSSRTLRGTPTDKWPARIELLPWLSGMLLAGAAIIVWLSSQN